MNDSAKTWIDLSLSDLKSSQLLYDNGHFRTSYFLFQQATEKANKAFALLGGQLTEKDFQEIKHDQLKIYRKAIVKQEGDIKNMLQKLEPYPEAINHELFSQSRFVNYRNSLLEGVSFIDSLKNVDLVNIEITDLNYLLRQLGKIKTSKIKTPKNFEKKFNDIILKIADWIGQFKTEQAIQAKAEFLNAFQDKERVEEFHDFIIKHFCH